jgi:hypothetical protein
MPGVRRWLRVRYRKRYGAAGKMIFHRCSDKVVAAQLNPPSSARPPEGCSAEPPLKSIFAKRNSGGIRGTTQFLQFEQHREHAFELSVEMNLVAGEAFEPVGIDGFAKCLSAN